MTISDLLEELINKVPNDLRDERVQYIRRFLSLPEEQQMQVCAYIISREEYLKDLERPVY